MKSKERIKWPKNRQFPWLNGKSGPYWRRLDRQTATAPCTTRGHKIMMAAVRGETSVKGQIPLGRRS
jgi:hypothetical protein